MNEDQSRQSNLVETTDCLEAVGVFRAWKNFFFIVVALSLLLLQISFWLVNIGYIEAAECAQSNTSAGQVEDTEEIEKAAEEVATEPNQPTETLEQQPVQKARSLFGITFGYLTRLIWFVNGVLILAATLYCLTTLFSLKVSLIGRLGGINHICRAFFLSLVMLVLLLPWQTLFAHIVVGAIYTPSELAKWCAAEKSGIFSIIIYYMRFTGYWAVVLLLLIFSQLRSSRWTKAILRRLEVI